MRTPTRVGRSGLAWVPRRGRPACPPARAPTSPGPPRAGSPFMGAYAKTAPGERLTYRPLDLSRYEGERFCLRITPEDIDLERCFFVYLDETFEDDSLRRLFQTYFVAPEPGHVAEMQ